MNNTTEKKGRVSTDLQSILGFLTLIGLGFGFAILLVNYGVFQPDNPNVVAIEKYNEISAKLENQCSEIKESLSVNTLILDTDKGQRRVIILKDLLDKIPFFIPTTASATGNLTKKEKQTNLLIAHWHAYRGKYSHLESEKVLMNCIEDIHSSNPHAKFLIYSSELSDKSIIRLKDQIPKSIKKNSIMWVSFSYDPDSCEIQLVLNKILNLGLELLPK